MAEGGKIFPDTPWWTNLVAVVLTVVTMLIATRASASTGAESAPTSSLIADTALFLPHALILFGILADMFRMEGVYSIASLIGLLSIFINKILDYFWAGIGAIIGKARLAVAAGTGRTEQQGGAVIDYKGCYVQGFEGAFFKSEYTSQTLVVTSTILVYYIMDLLMNKGIASAFPSLLVGSVLFLAQAGTMNSSGCFEDNTKATVMILTSLANGILFGGLSYGIVEAYFPSRLPSKVLPAYERVSLNDLTVNENGDLVDASGNSWLIGPGGSIIPNTCSSAAGGSSDPNSTGRAATSPACPKK